MSHDPRKLTPAEEAIVDNAVHGAMRQIRQGRQQTLVGNCPPSPEQTVAEGVLDRLGRDNVAWLRGKRDEQRQAQEPLAANAEVLDLPTFDWTQPDDQLAANAGTRDSWPMSDACAAMLLDDPPGTPPAVPAVPLTINDDWRETEVLDLPRMTW